MGAHLFCDAPPPDHMSVSLPCPSSGGGVPIGFGDGPSPTATSGQSIRTCTPRVSARRAPAAVGGMTTGPRVALPHFETFDCTFGSTFSVIRAKYEPAETGGWKFQIASFTDQKRKFKELKIKPKVGVMVRVRVRVRVGVRVNPNSGG